MPKKPKQLRLPSLKSTLVRQCVAFGVLVTVLAISSLLETTHLDRTINTQLGELQEELSNTQQKFESHLIWNNLSHRISLDTSSFLLEFELLTIDPDRDVARITILVNRLTDHHRSIGAVTNLKTNEDKARKLKEDFWILEGIALELLDTSSTNERLQLYRDSIEFVDAIITNTQSINAENIVLSEALKQRIKRVVEQSLDNQRQLEQILIRRNVVVFAISVIPFLIVVYAFVSLFKLLSQRIGMLEQYSLDIANQDYKRPPFSSKDITGRLAVRMGLMSRTIRKGLTTLKKSAKEIETLAYFDTLTGLENRKLFNENVERAVLLSRRHAEHYALVYLDLDFFKPINDSYGHEAGDKVLIKVAKRLRLTLREEDRIARLGGDEFAMLLRSDNTDFNNLIERVLNAVRQPIILDNEYELNISASVGIAILGVDTDNLSDLMRYTDMALYKAKHSGRNTFHYFSEQLETKALKKHKLLKDLKTAIEDDQLELFYQTQHDISGKHLTGVEALIRWPLPEGGFIFPDEFIPLAEESGLIMGMGEWIINRACRDGKKLNQLLGPLTIAINLSTRQFDDPELLEKIISSCRHHDLPHHLVELEITESLLLDDIKIGVKTLEGMKNAGFNIALDDFGTGYSSLFYLKNLPVTCIKIDRSFTAGLPADKKDAAIVETTILLAHRLKLKVVAEGIETQEQLRHLQMSHCDTAQGYLLGKPQPLENLIELFDN